MAAAEDEVDSTYTVGKRDEVGPQARIPGFSPCEHPRVQSIQRPEDNLNKDDMFVQDKNS